MKHAIQKLEEAVVILKTVEKDLKEQNSDGKNAAKIVFVVSLIAQIEFSIRRIKEVEE